MSVTLDTPHFPIGPCGPSKHSPFIGDSSRHAATALSSSALDCGENAGVGGRTVASNLKLLGQVEGNDGSVRVKVDIVFGRVHVRTSLRMRICARTTARIRWHADKEHKEQDQKMRRETNLCMLVGCSACICVCVCSCVYLCVIQCKRMSAWIAYPRAQPL